METELKLSRGRPKKYENGAKEYAKETKYSSDYYRNNKGQKCICEVCKKDVSKWTLRQHMKSKTCKSYLETIND